MSRVPDGVVEGGADRGVEVSVLEARGQAGVVLGGHRDLFRLLGRCPGHMRQSYVENRSHAVKQ